MSAFPRGFKFMCRSRAGPRVLLLAPPFQAPALSTSPECSLRACCAPGFLHVVPSLRGPCETISSPILQMSSLGLGLNAAGPVLTSDKRHLSPVPTRETLWS